MPVVGTWAKRIKWAVWQLKQHRLRDIIADEVPVNRRQSYVVHFQYLAGALKPS